MARKKVEITNTDENSKTPLYFLLSVRHVLAVKEHVIYIIQSDVA